MRWRHLRLHNTAHLISRLRRQLPLIGEAFGPLRRDNNLSVSLRLTAPLEGEPLLYADFDISYFINIRI